MPRLSSQYNNYLNKPFFKCIFQHLSSVFSLILCLAAWCSVYNEDSSILKLYKRSLMEFGKFAIDSFPAFQKALYTRNIQSAYSLPESETATYSRMLS